MALAFLRRTWCLGVAFLGVGLVAASAFGQPATPAKPGEPKEITLECQDLLQMKCMWYPGNKGKETVPIVILHGYKGSGDDVKGLALALQAQGHAVLVPDLRGHGKSTKIKRPNLKAEEVDVAKFKNNDFLQIAVRLTRETIPDLEYVKSYIKDRNNAEELNMEKLCVIGVGEMGCTLAVKWAITDWSWQTLATGKQGKDVRAIALISPEGNWKGLNLIRDLDDAEVNRLSYLVMAGRSSATHKADADRIVNKLKLTHPDPPKDEVREKQDLFQFQFESALQGAKLLALTPLYMDKAAQDKKQTTDINQLIAGFIQLRLVSKDYPWAPRKNALQ